MQKITLIILIVCFQFKLEAQIVNIENQRIVTDSAGWAGYVQFGLTASKDVNTVVNILSDAQIQLKTKRNLYLFRANSNFSRSGEQTFADNTFVHFRFNRKLSPLIRWEIFSQWQHNKITGINNRYLAGTGPRFKLLQEKNANIYLGTAMMYEQEEENQYDNTVKTFQVTRLSNYVSMSLKVLPNVKFSTTAYYQPLVDQFNDYRFFAQTVVGLDITKKLSFEVAYKILYDSSPAPTIPSTTYAIENFLKWKF